MVSIYTRTNNILTTEYLKWLIRKIIQKKSGPEAVLSSLVRGLDTLGIKHEIIPSKPTFEIVHVLSGIRALEDIINLKKTGKIKKIIAGPNLVTTPNDSNKILHDKNLDIILVPSKWVADFYGKSLSEDQSKKVIVWPAGIKMPQNETPAENRKLVLLFIKNVEKELSEDIKRYLQNEKILFEIIKYGKYKQEKYFSLLEKSRLMIYLQTVESQGMALQEAWVRNVPTLVLEKDTYVYPNGERAYGQVSAPYLTKESGLFFRDFEDFKLKLKDALQGANPFSPRKYCTENLSDEISTQKYLDIINRLKQ